ncbi:MAG: HD-GYP domain-containing protein [Clostridia bacterium]|nr:HD-GYP domain-containing protein [Clostridia bacterium]
MNNEPIALEIDEEMSEMKKMNDELTETNAVLESAYLELVETLRLAVEAKDNYTRGHSDRVSAYSVLLGEKLGLSTRRLKTLRIGGIFHDVGKIGVPDSILLKENGLNDNEYAEIKKHTVVGADMLQPVSYFKNILPIIKYHHEKYDGTGYPEGLKGEKIPYLARIVAVADSFDAMTSRRSYRNSLTRKKVIKQFEIGRGTQFDPQIADVMLDIINNEPEKIKEIQNRFEN